MRDLAALDPARFDAREHAALSWVREALTRREGPAPQTAERFESAFDEDERAWVVATMKAMYFFNLIGNTVDGWMRRLPGRREEEPAACALPGD